MYDSNKTIINYEVLDIHEANAKDGYTKITGENKHRQHLLYNEAINQAQDDDHILVYQQNHQLAINTSIKQVS